MQMKIVFLDVHGVLTSAGSVDVFGSRDEFEPVSAGLLRKLVKETGARIVITSSLRLDCSLSELREVFRQQIGKRAAKALLDTVGSAGTRAEQIAQWSAINDLDAPFVVLDDEVIPSQENLIRCCSDYGFQHPEYRAALEVLNG